MWRSFALPLCCIFISYCNLIIVDQSAIDWQLMRVHCAANGEVLLTWKACEKGSSWELVFLMGGGFALAEACDVMSLSNNIIYFFIYYL